MRKTILAVLGILIMVAAFFLMNKLIDSKEKPKPRATKVVKTVFIESVVNKTIPIVIPANGNLTAQRRIELFSEVQGVFKPNRKLFKPGQTYRKGEVLVRLDASEYYASVQSAKSNLYNLITSIMPDLRLDYPDAYPKWQGYLNNFDMGRSTPALPQTTSEQEKFFITGRNIYTTYYNVKNLEERLSKFSIRAPFAGVLTEALVTEGTLVRNGQKLGTFIDPLVYEMEVAIPAAYGNLLKVGETVQLTNLEKTASYSGEVIRVNASVDRTSQTISAFIQAKDPDLKEGMYLEANLVAKQEENAIEISRNLLQPNDQLFYVRNDTILNAITVQPVYFSEKNVVVKGVPNGTKILARPVSGAFQGMLVEVFQEEAPSDLSENRTNASE